MQGLILATVLMNSSVIFSKTRFRWFQESSVYRDAPAFALDGVYISEPCPNHCGGHGDCISGVCFCDMGYTGNARIHTGLCRLAADDQSQVRIFRCV